MCVATCSSLWWVGEGGREGVRTYVHVVEYSTRDMHVHVVEMLWRGPYGPW